LPIPAQRCQGWRGVNSKGVEELPNQNKHMTPSSSSSSFSSSTILIVILFLTATINSLRF
jgi:hypothetical protein